MFSLIFRTFMPTNMNLVFMPKKIAIYVLVVPKRHEYHTSLTTLLQLLLKSDAYKLQIKSGSCQLGGTGISVRGYITLKIVRMVRIFWGQLAFAE